MNLSDLRTGEIYHSGDKGMPRQMPVLLVEKGRLWTSTVVKGKADGLAPVPDFPPTPQRVGDMKISTIGHLVVTRAFGQRNDDYFGSLITDLSALEIPALAADPKLAAVAVHRWQEELDEQHLMLIASSSRVWPSTWTDHVQIKGAGSA